VETESQQTIPPTLAYRLYAFTWGLVGLALVAVALPSVGQFGPSYWLFLALAAGGNLFMVQWAPGVTFNMQGPVVLSSVWLFGWQAVPPMILTSALFLFLYRISPWRILLFMGNTSFSVVPASLLFHRLAGPLGLDASWTVLPALLGAGALFSLFNVLILSTGRFLHTRDRNVVTLRVMAPLVGFMVLTYVPLSYVLAVTFLTGPASHALTVVVWLLMSLAVKGMMESQRAKVLLEQAAEELRRLSITDPLTGLSNRRHFLEVLDREIHRHRRDGRSFGLLLLDLRGLKHINDTQGHPAGDAFLQRAAATVRERARASDFPFRIGGDEFAVLLPNTDRRGAATVADRLCTALSAHGADATIGIAVFPEDGATGDALLAAADRRLYAARRTGRPVGVAEEPLTQLH
jgi:diguanylate cyclase (GGDEF)-like protein